MGSHYNIRYDPSVPGSWELAFSQAVLMSKTCSRPSAIIGDTITLKGTGSSGTPPYTIAFKKDGAELARFTEVPAGTTKVFTYTTGSGDAGTRRFSHEIIDAAGKTCSEYCDIVVSASGPNCNFEVN